MYLKQDAEETNFDSHTVPAPLKGVPYFQELFFGPLYYHIKNT